MSNHRAKIRRGRVARARGYSDMGLAMENSTEAQQSACIREVLGINRKENGINYLVRLGNQTTKLLASKQAKQICPEAIIHFYVKNCRLESGYFHVPKKFLIGV